MSTHGTQTNPLVTHRAIAAMAVALPLLALPGTALALEDTTTEGIVSQAIAGTELGHNNVTIPIDQTASGMDDGGTPTSSRATGDNDTQGDRNDAENDAQVSSTNGDIDQIDIEIEPISITETLSSTQFAVSTTTVVMNVSPITPAPTDEVLMSASAETISTTTVGTSSELARAEIANGIYEIASVSNTAQRLGVQGDSTATGAKVQSTSAAYTLAQSWRFTKNSDGSYSIINVNSGKALAVVGSKATQNAGVQQAASNSSSANQRWFIEYADAAEQALVFRSALDNAGFVLEIASANTRINPYSGAKSQSFSLVETRQIDNGVYVIANASGKVLDVNGAGLGDCANVLQHAKNNGMNQYFYVQYNSSTGCYTFTNVQSGKVLDVSGAKRANCANVIQYTYNGNKNQQWMIRKRANGTYGIFSALGGMALDVYGASMNNCANVEIYTPNNGRAQQWNFSKPLAASTWLSGRTYQVLMGNNTSNSLTVADQATGNSAQTVTGAASANGTFEKWQVVWNGNYIRLVNIATGKALDVNGASSARGTRVQQYTPSSSNGQLWLPTMTTTGLKLQSALASNIVLDITTNSKATGAKLETWTNNNGYNQRFVFKPASIVDSGYVYTLRVDMDGTGSSTNYVLDVPGASKASGTALISYAYNGNGNQQFLIYSVNGGYRIQNITSGLYLTSVKGSGQVTQTSATDTSTLWTFAFSSKTNSVNIVSQQTKLAITTASPSSTAVSASAAKANGVGQGFWLTRYTGYVRGNDHGRLSGIDISSWNAGINLSKVACDFVIIKATQGTTYVNPYMKEQVASAIGAGKLIGFYHFADTSKGAANEARFFYNTVRPYIGQAVLVYDWENNDISHQNNLSRGPAYAKTFLDTVYNLSHVKPLIYMSRSVTTSYNWSSVANAGYELWVAQYLNQYYYTTVRSHVNNPTLANGSFGAWSKPAIYQYTSTGQLSGHSGSLDLDVFYGNRADWLWLAGKR